MKECPSLHALAAFLAVVDHETMTAAAEALSLSQPAISMQVKALEGFFGTPLIERRGRRVYPTAAELVVADYTRQLLRLTDEMANAVGDLEGLRSGTLVIGASSTVGEQMLPVILGQFHRLYPGIKLALSIGNSDEITQRVLDRTLDLGIIGKVRNHLDLELRPVFDDALEIFVAPDHPLAGISEVRVRDLHGATFVVRESGSATRELALNCLATHSCIPGETIELGSNESVKRAVSVGLGIGVLSTHSIAVDRQAGAVVVLSCPNWECIRQFWLIHRRERALTRAELAFIDLL